MKIALLADAFPPMATSASVQLRDLAAELKAQGHDILVVVASPDIKDAFVLEQVHNVDVLRLRTRQTKNVGLMKRLLGELTLSFFMIRNFRLSPFASVKFDGVIWYSPTIFLGPAVRHIKQSSNARGYLVLRDIFPEWAIHVGVLKRGILYSLFKLVEHYQYRVADVIGVQSEGNLSYFEALQEKFEARLEVLNNWLAAAAPKPSPIQLARTQLKGRKIIIYAGNVGVAQGMDFILALIEQMQVRHDIGFVFVGRGSELERLRVHVASNGLNNVLFFDEIEHDELLGLFCQCSIGLVSLDLRHQTQNIPGKFLSYLQSGLPVLAIVNEGNDLVEIIDRQNVGEVISTFDLNEGAVRLDRLLSKISIDPQIVERCKNLAGHMFSVKSAALQIVAALNQTDSNSIV